MVTPSTTGGMPFGKPRTGFSPLPDSCFTKLMALDSASFGTPPDLNASVIALSTPVCFVLAMCSSFFPPGVLRGDQEVVQPTMETLQAGSDLHFRICWPSRCHFYTRR